MIGEHVYSICCPHCNNRIKYNRDYYDYRITQLGAEIERIKHQLEFPNTDSLEWREKAKRALYAKTEQLTALKEVRKQSNWIVEEQREKIFKRLVREKIGEEEYIKLRKQSEEEIIY